MSISSTDIANDIQTNGADVEFARIDALTVTLREYSGEDV